MRVLQSRLFRLGVQEIRALNTARICQSAAALGTDGSDTFAMGRKQRFDFLNQVRGRQNPVL